MLEIRCILNFDKRDEVLVKCEDKSTVCNFRASVCFRLGLGLPCFRLSKEYSEEDT